MALLSIGPDSIDEAAVARIAAQYVGLEKKLYEFKKELGNGLKTLEAVASMANDVGGLVLIGVDEDETPGGNRLIGVARKEFDRLKDFCVGRLVPSFCPELVPVELSNRDEIVIAAFVDPDSARRPVMIDRKVYVRNEAGKTLADWYQLRNLFEEAPALDDQAFEIGRSLVMMRLQSVAEPPPFIAVRLIVRVLGVRGQRGRIHERGRAQLLDVLTNAPLTGAGAALPGIAFSRAPSRGAYGWSPVGDNSSSKLTLEWALVSDELRAVEARLIGEIVPIGNRPTLVLQADAMVRITMNGARRITLESLYGIGEGLLATLWGDAGKTAAEAFLGVPLGPPAFVELSVAGPHEPDRKRITEFVDFSPAVPIVGSHGAFGGTFTTMLDRECLAPEGRAAVAREWIEDLGMTVGLNYFQSAIARFLPPVVRAAAPNE